jgi:predicted MFS family arabinose efflux permease
MVSPPRLAASAAAVAYGTGLVVYAPAGRWSEHSGPAHVVRAALGVRLLAFGVLWGLGWTPWEHRRWLALLGYLTVVLAWSALSVGGTGWTARLAWRREGEGLGLFNATSALAGVLGAGLGGWLTASWGLHAVWGLVITGVGLGLFLTLVLCPRPRSTA